jgi:tetratricopeptide (TPR) repeat protein
MKSLYCGALLLAAMTTAAWAGGYSDFNAGMAARSRGDSAEAIRLFGSALDAQDLPKPTRAMAYFNRAELYIWNRQNDLALADLNGSLAITPNYTPALETRGYVHQRRKEFDLAQGDFEAVIAIRPDSANGPGDLVGLNIARKSYEAALKLSNDAIDKWPYSGSPYLMRANTYHAMGQHDAAMDDYDTAVSKSDHSVEALASRAKAYEKDGNLEKALSDLQEGADESSGTSDIHDEVGFLQWDLGRFEDSEKTLRTVISVGSTWSYAFLWLYLAEAKSNPGKPAVWTDGAKLDETRWPSPLARLFSGKGTVDDVLKDAATGDSAAQSDKLCEANFYAGEWQILHGKQSAGLNMLSAAKQSCPVDFVEKTAAVAELARQK